MVCSSWRVSTSVPTGLPRGANLGGQTKLGPVVTVLALCQPWLSFGMHSRVFSLGPPLGGQLDLLGTPLIPRPSVVVGLLRKGFS